MDDKPGFDLPSFGRRALTPGNAIAAVLGTVVVYVGWGIVFGAGGTGSNVVLGLLLAGAAIYLAISNGGPLIDDALPLGGTREGRELRRHAILLLTDLERALVADHKADPKKRRLDVDIQKNLLQLGHALRKAVAPLLTEKVHADDDIAKTKAAIESLEAAVKLAYGSNETSFFAQARSLTFAFAVALALRAFVVEPFQIPSGSMIPTLLVGDHLFVARFQYGLQVPFTKTPRYFVRWSIPEPGDVIVFVAPPSVMSNAGEDWIKRVIAVPGQHVRMVDDELFVDDKPYTRTLVDADAVFLDYETASDRWDKSSAAHFREEVRRTDGEIVSHSSFYSIPSRETWPLGTWQRLPGLTCTETDCVVDEGHVFVMGDNRDNSNDGRKWGAVPVDNVKGKAKFIWISVDGSERSLSVGKFTLPSFRWDRLFTGIH